MGCHALLQGIFPTQESNPGPLHRRQILYRLSHCGERGRKPNTRNSDDREGAKEWITCSLQALRKKQGRKRGTSQQGVHGIRASSWSSEGPSGRVLMAGDLCAGWVPPASPSSMECALALSHRLKFAAGGKYGESLIKISLCTCLSETVLASPGLLSSSSSPQLSSLLLIKIYMGLVQVSQYTDFLM